MSVRCGRHPESNHEPWQCPGETREDRLEAALREIVEREDREDKAEEACITIARQALGEKA